MTGALKLKLLPIKSAASVCVADGDGVYPPSLQLNFQIKAFVEAWKAEESRPNKNPTQLTVISIETDEELISFFNYIEAIARNFPHYNFPGCDKEIFGLTTAIMTQIPWEWLPEAIREEKLRNIFANKDFRQRSWRDYLQLQSSGVGRGFVSAIGINRVVADVMLEYEDVRLELLTLSIARIVLFVQVLPQLMLQVVTLAYQLWFHGKIATHIALNILTPLLSDKNADVYARNQARSLVAEIEMTERNLGAAKPHLDALAKSTQLNSDQISTVQCHHLAYRRNLLTTLEEFDQQLTDYLSSRQTDGFFYWIGIYNKQLSDKKNTMVIALQTDLKKLMNDLALNNQNFDFNSIPEPVDTNVIVNFSKWISRAESMNKAYYNQYTGYFDGKGSLGDILRTAREELAALIPKSSEAIHDAEKTNKM